ncbi:PRC-barrel domain-containing protein [Filomicrobium insigne]|uniref:PRC-barrel domain-containing protein n=1 Tax=Filomicrobium insigne TaxID=418854 RepID=A0A1H0Q3V5_9HYPH|nr:DUF937 domain-containing protein [Filomicrobium insigne]SDP11715.1 PRC-barrel domain-containing protein [Filomicrobium insigne]
MTTNLVSTITQVLNSDVVARIASSLGLDKAKVGRAIQAGVPGLLAALTSLVSKPAGASALLKTVSQQDPSVLSSLASTLGASGKTAFIDRGANSLSSLLGSTTMSALTNSIGRYAGVGAESSKSLMGLLGPVVLGVLGQQQRTQGLDAAALGGLLASQKDNISRALPAGFAEHLKDTGILDGIGGVKASSFKPAYAKPQPTSSNLGWVLPALGILAVGALAWYLLRNPTKEVATLPPAKIESRTTAPNRVTFTVTADEAKNWIAKPVYSSDNRKIGEIIEINRDPNNNVTEVFMDTGSFLGIGATRYRITSDQIQEVKPDALMLTIKESEVTKELQGTKNQPQ